MGDGYDQDNGDVGKHVSELLNYFRESHGSQQAIALMKGFEEIAATIKLGLEPLHQIAPPIPMIPDDRKAKIKLLIRAMDRVDFSGISKLPSVDRPVPYIGDAPIIEQEVPSTVSVFPKS